MIDINYCSQKGLCDTNQDFILCKQLQDGSCIAILADGMGGLQYGEIAAATVAQSIYKILAEHIIFLNATFPRTLAEISLSIATVSFCISIGSISN